MLSCKPTRLRLTPPTRHEYFRFSDKRRCVEGDQPPGQRRLPLSSRQSSRILQALSLVSSYVGKVRPGGNGRLEKLETSGPHVPRALRLHLSVENRTAWSSWL